MMEFHLSTKPKGRAEFNLSLTNDLMLTKKKNKLKGLCSIRIDYKKEFTVEWSQRKNFIKEARSKEYTIIEMQMNFDLSKI